MLLAILILLAAVGLLVAALVTSHIMVAWGSVGASVAAALILLVRQRRSRLRGRGRTDVSPEDSASPEDDVSPEDGAQPGGVQPGAEGSSAEDPGEEDTDAADLLVVWEMTDEVVVVDEHPRYHLARCQWPGSARTERLPVREARELGFTPCALCRPDAALARRQRTSSTI